MKKLPLLLVTLIASSLTAVASASIVRAAPFKDTLGVIHIQDAGIIAAQKIPIATNTPITKNTTFNQCGLATVSAPSSTIPMPGSVKVNASAVNVLALPIGVMPKCAIGTGGTYSFSIPTTANFKTSDGKLGIIGTANTAAIISYDGVFKSKNLTANKCGMASLGSTTSPAPTSFGYGGVTYTTASLPVKVPNRCINAVRYAPVTP